MNGRSTKEFARFAAVGLSGVGVNLGLLYVLTRGGGLSLRLAAPLAIEASVISNFLLNDGWTFGARAKKVGPWTRLARFHAVCLLGGIVNYVVLLSLVEILQWHDLLANLVGIAASTFVKFSMHSIWTWSEPTVEYLASQGANHAVANRTDPFPEKCVDKTNAAGSNYLLLSQPNAGRMSDKKRILWVTFDFPPRQSSGVFRPVKLYKYLDKDAFDIDFLTQSPTQAGIPVDPTLLDELPATTRVYRVPNIVLSSYVDGMARRDKKKPVQGTRAEQEAPSRRPRWRTIPRRAAKRVYVLLAMLLYFPDQYFIWGWLAALKALSLHRTRHYDLVYTTSHPESGHLAGLLLKAFGVKWVADYRYAGVLWIKKLLTYPKKRLREWSEFRYQRSVLRRADLVITQSETIRRDFHRAFGVETERMKVISSGYDDEDFTGTNGHGPPFEKRGDEIHLLHAGASYLDTADQSRLIAVLNGLGNELGIVLHALGDDLFPPELKPNIRGFRYFFHGFVQHCALPPYLAAADWYLLLTVTSVSGAQATHGYLPSKMWEYLRGGKPILLFGPDDEVWKIIDHARAGLYMGRLDDDLHISAADLVQRARSLAPIASRVEEHSWKSRARAMQQAFSMLLEGRRLQIEEGLERP